MWQWAKKYQFLRELLWATNAGPWEVSVYSDETALKPYTCFNVVADQYSHIVEQLRRSVGDVIVQKASLYCANRKTQTTHEEQENETCKYFSINSNKI